MPIESPINAPAHDAQREMEQRALRNVRALVDKIEDADKLSERSARRTMIVVIVAITLVLAFFVSQLAKPPAPISITLPPPAKTAR